MDLEQILKSVNLFDNDFANKTKQNQTAQVQCAKPALHVLITPDNDVCNTHHPHTHSRDQYIITLTISIISVELEMGICGAKHSSERDIKVRRRDRGGIKQLTPSAWGLP